MSAEKTIMIDSECKEKIKNWAIIFRQDTMKMVQYLYPKLFEALAEMEKEAGIEPI